MNYLVCRIGDHCQVGDGAHGSLKRVDEGVPYITAKNLKEGRLELDGAYFIDELTFSKHFKCDSKALTLPIGGDVIFGIIGSLGQAYRVNNGDRFGLSSSIAMLRPTQQSLDSDYLYYWVTGPEFQQAIYLIKGGVAQSYISLEMIRSLPLWLPPLPMQGRIATTLSAYDDLIENNTRRIAILEEMARRLYEEWFVRFRFPGHEGVPLVESELGLVPQGWDVVQMEQVCTRITDGSHSSPKSVEVGKPMASVKDMHDWGINLSTCRRIAEDEYVKLVRNDCKPMLNDVLIAKDGSYLKHTFVMAQEIDLVILSSIAILRPNGKLLPNQLSMYLRLPDVASRMKGYVSGVAIPRIVLRDFRQFLVLLAPKSIQDKWAELCDPILDLCRNLVRRNENLRTTRDLLLPKLISGELDVSTLPEPLAETL
jgi:type I restriction enzyme S subunit